MKRTEKDVVWSDVAQGFRCLWCGQPAIEVSTEAYECFNDPECLEAAQEVAAEAAKLENEIAEQESNWLRTLALSHPAMPVMLNQEEQK